MNRFPLVFLKGSVVLLVSAACVISQAMLVLAESQSKDRTFTAIVTDSQGVESEIKNVFFYWEEKVSETAFVPHELRDVPVKKGTATIKVKFEQIKQIEVKPPADAGMPTVVITLAGGKTGEFLLAIKGSFKGISDFGETEFPADGLKKIVFK